MRPADIDIAPGTPVRCRLASGETADAVVTAVRHFPVDFIEVQFVSDGTKLAIPRSEIAGAITENLDDVPAQDVPGTA